MLSTKSIMIKDAQILWTLRSNFSRGDENKAFTLLLAISNASEGLVEDYSPEVKLLGSENRQGVTCFLDATLFCMFTRLDSFEGMLYNNFDDKPRRKLVLLLRLWVNLLRTGNLITTDITQLIQESLSECGWREAAKLHQQDASEAFSFITGKLELPLLTLKMDIYHTGKEDTNDDHKFINERLLEVAIPQDRVKDHRSISLEECLEEYFNNRVEVRRYLERRSTLQSLRSFDVSKKAAAVHVETIELDSDSSSATLMSSSPSNIVPTRPSIQHRAPSIIQERYVPDSSESGHSSLSAVESQSPISRFRSGSIRKEVMMPAWQFFSLIPWYTDHAPANDAQVATHFSSKRPVLGLCLKRYSMTPQGRAVRLNTNIDIPIEIGLPHFIQDDHMENDGPLYGNFKLSLQAVVCHRGVSVDSGHYIALARSTNMKLDGSTVSTSDSVHWMRFDDLALQRVTLVGIEEALKDETPYLLFYQIVPMEGDLGHSLDEERPPVYPVSEEDGYAIGGSTASLGLQTSRDGRSTVGGPGIDMAHSDNDRGQGKDEARTPSIVFPGSSLDASGDGLAERVQTQSSSGAASPGRRKSGEQSRRSSGAFEGGLSRTLSKLKGRNPKETRPSEYIGALEARVGQNPNVVVATLEPAAVSHPPKAVSASQKLQKQEKNRSRVGRRTQESKPDRECLVM